MVKNLPANAGDARDEGSIPGSGRSPGEERATHPSILAWKMSWTVESGRLQSMASQRVRHNRATENTHTHRKLYLFITDLLATRINCHLPGKHMWFMSPKDAFLEEVFSKSLEKFTNICSPFQKVKK